MVDHPRRRERLSLLGDLRRMPPARARRSGVSRVKRRQHGAFRFKYHFDQVLATRGRYASICWSGGRSAETCDLYGSKTGAKTRRRGEEAS